LRNGKFVIKNVSFVIQNGKLTKTLSIWLTGGNFVIKKSKIIIKKANFQKVSKNIESRKNFWHLKK
jgi:hypothetical protein